jgi:hypothetical protein
MASDVNDFPEPDSPTNPKTFPAEIEKLRSRTACTPESFPWPSAIWAGNAILSRRTSSSEATIHGSNSIAIRAKTSCRYLMSQPTAIPAIPSFTSQLAAYEATKTRCSFINAALVRIRGKGAISQIASASLSAPAME